MWTFSPSHGTTIARRLGAAGERQLHFFIAEEGITAAA
jgi:hypothetical protein